MGDPSEVLLFRAPLDGGSATSGIFGAQVGSPFVWVLEGDTAPDTGGGAYSSFDWRPTYGASVPHHVLFQASVTGGTATSGIFFVPEPVGGLWPGLALLGVMSLRRVPARREAR